MIQETIKQLTVNIRDLQAKPALRPVLEAELLKMSYTEQEIKPALDNVFKVTLQ